MIGCCGIFVTASVNFTPDVELVCWWFADGRGRRLTLQWWNVIENIYSSTILKYKFKVIQG